MRPGRLALLPVTTAYVVALAWAAVVLPDRVPSHFDAAGRVDDWSSRPGTIVFWALVGSVVLAGIPTLSRALLRGDGTWINMPQASKDHWLAPERRAEFRVRFQDDIEGFTALTGVLLVAALTITTRVATTGGDGAPWWVFACLVGGYVVLTTVWVVRLLAKYRPPAAA